MLTVNAHQLRRLAAARCRFYRDQIAAADRGIRRINRAAAADLRGLWRSIGRKEPRELTAVETREVEAAIASGENVDALANHHADVAPIPADAGDVGPCDWRGDCTTPATCLRFDAYGHGWLPCCDPCAAAPEDDAPAPPEFA